jgi:hypothetical protein
MEQVAEAKKLWPTPMVCIEQTLVFSNGFEHGFGTGDCVIVADDLLHIVDLKYAWAFWSVLPARTGPATAS